MIDIRQIVSRITTEIPSLTLRPTYVKEDTLPPYAMYESDVTPIRTCDGICGYEGEFRMSIFERSKERLDELLGDVVDALDGYDTADTTSISFSSSQYDYDDTTKLHLYDLIFKMLQ